MTFTGQTADGRTVTYTDSKRYFWFLSFIFACVALLSVALYFWTGSLAAVFLPILYMYVAVPGLDFLFGEDTHNPPEEVIDAMANDPFYRRLLHAAVPAFWASFLVAVWFVGSQDLPWWAMLLFAVGVGMLHGDVLTISHELGHKTNATDQFFAKIANAMIGYAHFCIEHNRGHHVQVSTPEDPASSRMGESIYAFSRRELPGAFFRGWEHEKRRLSKRGKSAWSIDNDILQGYAITVGVAVVVIALFGWKMLPFLVVHHFVGWYGLTQANYVEHYGLLRQKLPNGRYEAVQPRHSWNTNHIVSNLLTFHLQRHSDHHANALRPYQALRDFPDLPRLPSGYPGMYALASIPALWFAVMDPKVMAWAGGDLAKVNVHKPALARLERTYGKPAALRLAA